MDLNITGNSYDFTATVSARDIVEAWKVNGCDIAEGFSERNRALVSWEKHRLSVLDAVALAIFREMAKKSGPDAMVAMAHFAFSEWENENVIPITEPTGLTNVDDRLPEVEG